MPKLKCIVPGCNYDESTFCEIHRCPIEECECSSTKKVSYSRFPFSPLLRAVWLKLLKLPKDYLPKTNAGVCSRHFDLSGNSRSQQRKVPTLEIGRSETEVQDILARYIASMAERQKKVLGGMNSPSSINRLLIEATAEAIAALEEQESGPTDTEVFSGKQTFA